MKKKILIVLGGLLATAILFGAASVTTAYAQDETPPTPPVGQPGDGPGHGGGRGMHETELTAAAAALGMTTDEVSAALKEGKTLDDLATAAGVDIQDVQDAISAARAEEMRTRIEAGLADGSISQDKADWLLEGLDKGFLDGPGFGFGGPRGEKPGMPPTQPADQ
jgi:Spy/CpxP family protein refolding chaperone